MDNKNIVKKLVAIISTDTIEEQINKSLSSQKELEFEIIKLKESFDVDLLVSKYQPDIVLVEHQKGTELGLDILDKLSMNYSDIPGLAILHEDDPSEAQRTLMAGARTFILSPFTKVNILSVVQRVLELQDRSTKSQAPQESTSLVSSLTMGTIAVFSPRGGVGNSTFAVNLALSILEQTKKSVLLLDGKQFFGHVDVMLNIRTRNSIADLVPHASNLDEGLIRDVVVEHASGLKVLLAPPSLQIAQGIRPENIYNIMVGLQSVYDYIIIDGGNALNENTVTLLDSSFKVVMLLKPDMASLRDIRQFLEISQSLSYPNEKLLIVLNEANSKGSLQVSDIEVALQHKLFGSIPSDQANALRSINRGIPLNIHYPKSPISKAISNIGKEIISVIEKEMTSPIIGKNKESAKQDALQKSSLFG